MIFTSQRGCLPDTATEKRCDWLGLLNLVLYVSLLALPLFIGGCSSDVLKPKPSVKAVFSIKVTDPIQRHLTEVTTEAEIEAAGRLRAGTYSINGVALTIAPDTTFQLQLSLPIDDPSIISTQHATGKLTTSVPLSYKGIPLPQTLVMTDGLATVDLDLLRMFGAYLLSVLENQLETEEHSDVHQIIDTLSIQRAALELKPDSLYHLGKKLLHLGEGSSVELRDVSVDHNLNYHGNYFVNFKLLDGCQWIGEKVDVDFNGGSAALKLDARRVNGLVTLSLMDRDSSITLNDCTFKFGEQKVSTAHSDSCGLKLRAVTWQKQEGVIKPTLHFLTAMDLNDTKLDVKTRTQETSAQFPGLVPATLQVDITKAATVTNFDTNAPESASSGRVTIIGPTTKLALWLANATVGPISLDKFGDLQFSIAQGSANVKQVDWTSGKKTFHLVASGASTLGLPKGMDLSLTKKPGGTKLTLPLTVKLGNAVLSGASGKRLNLSNLNGTMLITIDGDCRISSNLDLAISRSSLLGDQQAQVQARGFSLEARKGEVLAHISSCVVLLSAKVLEQAISTAIPKDKVFTLNKTFDVREWRYRDAIVNNVYVRNILVEQLKQKSANTADFTVSGNVECAGTVVKLPIKDIGDDSATGDTCPWRATAEHAVGTGSVTYQLIPYNSLSNSEISYDLKAQLPIPEDVELDWSKVSTGILRTLERMAIVHHLKTITVPLHYTGKVRLCAKNDTQWNSITISKFVATPAGNNTELHFVADGDF